LPWQVYYPEARKAVEWLTTALPFTERLRNSENRCQLVHENGAVVVATPGARVLAEPADHRYGERQCSFLDPWGHPWTLSETIFDSDPNDWGGELLIE
jgi:uncharacterized glyoxalase superfamily protein PhnB